MTGLEPNCIIHW